jgi:hypothetical protein
MYLITAKYTSDSERKRIEYALDKWRDRMQIVKPDGVTAIVKDGEIQELLLELYSRTERDNVAFYRIEEAHLDIAETEKVISLKLKERKETTEKLLDFIMARQRAILKLELTEPPRKIYEVITRKGKAEISLSLRGEGEYINVVVKISGYGEAVDFLHGKLAEELELLEDKE